MEQTYSNKIVWVIGASSGIGAALAKELSARGATLAMSARSKNTLETMTQELGSRHKSFALDITHLEQTISVAQEIKNTFGRIDQIIFMAAAYTPMKIDQMDHALAKQMVDVNITGALNVIYASLPIFKTQPTRGMIALCASVAGYIGLPGGQPYSATKAALINLAESLHAECSQTIDVKLICPGFVKTPLTDKNTFNMPFIITPQQAAREIADGLLKGGFEIHFPKKFTFFLKFLRLLPYRLQLGITRHLKSS